VNVIGMERKQTIDGSLFLQRNTTMVMNDLAAAAQIAATTAVVVEVTINRPSST